VHFALALGLIFILLAGMGIRGGSLTPDEAKWRVDNIEADTPAGRAGLRDGDDLVAVGGTRTETFEDVRDAVAGRPGDEVVLTVARDGRTFETTATLASREGDPTVGFLGVGETIPDERLGVLEAVPATFREFGTIFVQSAQGLGRVFSPSGIADFGSQVVNARDGAGATDTPDDAPASSGSSSSASATAEEDEGNRLLSLLGVFRIGVGFGDSGGVTAVMLLFAFMNIFIGMFNLLPILPFDGGHVAIAVYEKVQEWRKGLGQRYFADVGRLLPMTYAVVVVLGLIFVSTLYVDAVNPLTVG
jgi:membrane-associated protease RseP (regulator of RpoE activity)